MSNRTWMVMGFALVITLVLTVAGTSAQQAAALAKVQLPAAVAKVVADTCPGKQIGMVTAEKTGGITLYDVEFTGTQGEIEVAEDGTVIDVSIVITLADVPKAAADAIQKHATGAKIGRIEKSDVRAEIKEQGAKSTIVKLATPKVVYEAELIKGKVTAEVQVAPDGKVVEAPDWSGKEEKKEENEQADKPKVKK